MRFCLFVLFAMIFFGDFALAGQLKYYNPIKESEEKLQEENAEEEVKANMLVITPLEECYSKLEEKDVADIKKNYLKKYRECLRRVQIREREKNTLNLTKKDNAETSEKETKEKVEKEYIRNPDFYNRD